MLISPKHKFIFIHIPKTAGSSLNSVLAATDEGKIVTTRIGAGGQKFVLNAPAKEKDLIQWARDNKMPTVYEEKSKDYAHVYYPESKILCGQLIQKEGYFSFSFVRNPFDRAVSAFTYALRRKEFEGNENNVDPNFKFLDFKEFCKKYLKDKMFCDPVTRYNVHFLPQNRFIYDPIDSATKGEPFVDFVGKLENINEDFQSICKKIKLPNLKLPHARSQERKKPYQSFYDEESIDIVKTIYKKDLELFGYEFEGLKNTHLSEGSPHNRVAEEKEFIKEDGFGRALEMLQKTESMSSTKEGNLQFNSGKRLAVVTNYQGEDSRCAIETENGMLHYGDRQDYSVFVYREEEIDRASSIENGMENFEFVLWIRPTCLISNLEVKLEDLFEKYKKRFFVIDKEGDFILAKNHKYSKNILQKWKKEKDLSIKTLKETLKKSDPNGFNFKTISDPAIKGNLSMQSTSPLITSFSKFNKQERALLMKICNEKYLT